MPASGIVVGDEIIDVYNDMKKNKKIHYIKYRIEKETLFIKEVKKHGEEFDLKTDLPKIFKEDECSYVVIDMKFCNEQGGEREKLLFVSWSPDTAKVKDKMMHSSSKEPFIAKLVGIAGKVQATDASEVTYEAMLDAAKKHLTSK